MSAGSELNADRYTAIRLAYGDKTFQRIRQSNILVIGAGGIGCELLKTLVLTGFTRITVVDLDTIDVSNLNRQFLFRRHHVNKPKALIAAETVKTFNPDTSITAHHANVKSAQFDVAFIRGFTAVANALDNADARRHVNRLCIAAGVPLLESGTHGYTGQSTVYAPPSTQCYECRPMNAEKTFAVCTIRHTPDKPVHCVVWAKAVFAAVFGGDTESLMSELRPTQSQVANAESFSVTMAKQLFQDEIEQQMLVTARWKDRQAPLPIVITDPSSSATSSTSLFHYTPHMHRTILTREQLISLLISSITQLITTRRTSIGQLSFDKDDDLIMDIIYALCALRMYNFHIQQQSRFDIKGIAGNIIHAIATTNAIAAGLMVLELIKLVTAPPTSTTTTTSTTNGHEEKPTDDNVTHVTEYECVLPRCRETWIRRYPPVLLSGSELETANPNCYVCSHRPLTLTVNTHTFTLKNLFERVCMKRLSLNEPSIDVYNRDNFIGTMEDHQVDDDQEENNENDDDDQQDNGNEATRQVPYLLKTLDDPGVRCSHGALIAAEDMAQNVKVSLIIHHDDVDLDEHPEGFIIEGAIPKKESAANDTTAVGVTTSTDDSDIDMIKNGSEVTDTTSNGALTSAAVDDDDDVEIMDIGESVSTSVTSRPTTTSSSSSLSSTSRKRRRSNGASHGGRETDNGEPETLKHSKNHSVLPTPATDNAADDDVIEID